VSFWGMKYRILEKAGPLCYGGGPPVFAERPRRVPVRRPQWAEKGGEAAFWTVPLCAVRRSGRLTHAQQVEKQRRRTASASQKEGPLHSAFGQSAESQVNTHSA